MKSFRPAPLPPPEVAPLERKSESRSLAVPRFLRHEERSTGVTAASRACRWVESLSQEVRLHWAFFRQLFLVTRKHQFCKPSQTGTDSHLFVPRTCRFQPCNDLLRLQLIHRICHPPGVFVRCHMPD